MGARRTGANKLNAERGTDPSWTLIDAVITNEAGAWNMFIDQWGALLFGCCKAASNDGDDEDRLCRLLEALRGDDFQRLRPRHRRGSVATYLILAAADILAADIVQRFADDPADGWVAFEHFFAPDLKRITERRAIAMPADAADDLHQDLVQRLLADGGARFAKFDGRGNFPGYVRQVARNLCEDLVRQRLGRKREPETIRALPALERACFKLLYGEGLTIDQLPNALANQLGRDLDPPCLRGAVKRMEGALTRARAAGWNGESKTESLDAKVDAGMEFASLGPDPEAALAERQEQDMLEVALNGLERAMARLPETPRLYLHYRFLADPPLAPKRIAAMLGLGVDELYKQRKNWERLLLDALRTEEVKNFPLPSVSDN